MRLVLLIAAVCTAFCTTGALAAPRVQVSCFHPNAHIAGRTTPNPHHYPVVANKQLPFGTIVEFFSELGTAGRKFIVMDRGPFVKGRSYDIDCAAGRAAGFPRLGWLYAHVLGRE